MERGIMFAHRSILEHEVLQRVMQTEPDKLLPDLTVESIRIREGIAEFLVPTCGSADWPTAWTSTMPPTSWPGWSCRTSPHPGAGTGRPGPGRPAGPVRAPGRSGGAGRAAMDRYRARAAAAARPWRSLTVKQNRPTVPRVGVPRRHSGWSACGHRGPSSAVPAAPRPRRRSERSPHRVRIIDATLVCLARHGTVKTTVDDIARESGVSRATVYRAFPGGRDEILARGGGHRDGPAVLGARASVLGLPVTCARPWSVASSRPRPASATTPPCTSWWSTSPGSSSAIWPSTTPTGCWPPPPGSPPHSSPAG